MDCHCPKCEWEGFWDDTEWSVQNEPRGEAWGSPVSAEVYTYLCPICRAEVDTGPAPSDDLDLEELDELDENTLNELDIDEWPEGPDDLDTLIWRNPAK
jgi:hypothetical protein